MTHWTTPRGRNICFTCGRMVTMWTGIINEHGECQDCHTIRELDELDRQGQTV